MTIIRNFIFLSVVIAYLTISNVNAKNIEDFGWSFENDFFEVYSSIEHVQPNKCQLNINEFKVNNCAGSVFHGITIVVDCVKDNPDTFNLLTLRRFWRNCYPR